MFPPCILAQFLLKSVGEAAGADSSFQIVCFDDYVYMTDLIEVL